ncbi:MAG: flavodoxin [Lachnospiraceae bacterium]|nr:flavodoxin [Lachnospiraceae bacterium]
MSRVAVVFWSGTGNTAAMAEAVAEGARAAGADVTILGPTEFTAEKAEGFDGIAFGCPAMGAEVLEEYEFEPMFTDVEGLLAGKKIALFGSYGWGDGQWMRDWEDRCFDAGIRLAATSVMANYAPSEADQEMCRALGRALV